MNNKNKANLKKIKESETTTLKNFIVIKNNI